MHERMSVHFAAIGRRRSGNMPSLTALRIAEILELVSSVNESVVPFVKWFFKMIRQPAYSISGSTESTGLHVNVRARTGALGCERNPTKQTLYFDYAVPTPQRPNEKCSYWQIRWAANIDMKVLCACEFSQGTGRYQEALFVQWGLLDGQGIQKAMRTNMPKSVRRPNRRR